MENFSYLKSPAWKSDRASPLCLSLTPPLPPSLSFLFSGFLARQMRGEGQPTPLYRGGGPAAPQRGGLGGRPPGCRAAGSQGPVRNLFSSLFLQISPCRPAAGVYFCKFPYRKYIFVKNGNKKYKNKKNAKTGL